MTSPEQLLTTPDGQLALLVLLHNLEEQVKIPFRTILCTPYQGEKS